MCTELIEHGKDAFKAMLFGRGIAWSIALLLAVPALLVGGISLGIVIQVKKKAVIDNQKSETK